jgi:hypothetical protein
LEADFLNFFLNLAADFLNFFSIAPSFCTSELHEDIDKRSAEMYRVSGGA